jgi:hypothetical protein
MQLSTRDECQSAVRQVEETAGEKEAPVAVTARVVETAKTTTQSRARVCGSSDGASEGRAVAEAGVAIPGDADADAVVVVAAAAPAAAPARVERPGGSPTSAADGAYLDTDVSHGKGTGEAERHHHADGSSMMQVAEGVGSAGTAGGGAVAAAGRSADRCMAATD